MEVDQIGKASVIVDEAPTDNFEMEEEEEFEQ